MNACTLSALWARTMCDYIASQRRNDSERSAANNMGCAKGALHCTCEIRVRVWATLVKHFVACCLEVIVCILVIDCCVSSLQSKLKKYLSHNFSFSKSNVYKSTASYDSKCTPTNLPARHRWRRLNTRVRAFDRNGFVSWFIAPLSEPAASRHAVHQAHSCTYAARNRRGTPRTMSQ